MEFRKFSHPSQCEYSLCWNCCNLVSHIFGTNFMKVMLLLKKLLKGIWGQYQILVCLGCLGTKYCYLETSLKFAMKNSFRLVYHKSPLVKVDVFPLVTPFICNDWTNFLIFHEIPEKKLTNWSLNLQVNLFLREIDTIIFKMFEWISISDMNTKCLTFTNGHEVWS